MKIQIRDNIVVRELPDGVYLVVDYLTGKYFNVNRVGYMILKYLQENESSVHPNQIVSHLATTFNKTDISRIEQDVEKFIQTLHSLEMLEGDDDIVRKHH